MAHLLPSLIDDSTRNTLIQIYGHGVMTVFEGFQAVDLSVFGQKGEELETRHTLRHSYTSSPAAALTSSTAIDEVSPAAPTINRKERHTTSQATRDYRAVCAAFQVRPNAEMHRCCSAADLFQWVEASVMPQMKEFDDSVDSQGDVIAKVRRCIDLIQAGTQTTHPINRLREGTNNDAAAVNEALNSSAAADSDHLKPAYMQHIESYLFAEERAKAEAEAKLAANQREKEMEACAEATRVHSRIDLNLLFLAEDDHRSMIEEIEKSELASQIVKPFVSLLHRHVSVLSFERSALGTNGLMAIIASLRCVGKYLKSLSFANCGKEMDTPLAILLFSGPLKKGYLPLLETIVLDRTPMGSTAIEYLTCTERYRGAGSTVGAQCTTTNKSNLSRVSLLDVTIDPTLLKKLESLLEPRKRQQQKERDERVARSALEDTSEPSGRSAIVSAASLEWFSIISKFLTFATQSSELSHGIQLIE